MGKIKKSQAFPKRLLPRIFIHKEQKSLPLTNLQIKQVVYLILGFFSVECEAVAINFVSKKAISKLHKDFFNDRTPTDCITFPIDSPYEENCVFLGEIFVCPQIALEYAKKHRKNPNLELILYIVHGLLHLLEYNDESPLERRRMRQMEKKCLSLLEANNIFFKTS